MPLFPEIPFPLARNEQFSFKGNRRLGRHGWLRLTPAYSVPLIRELIASCPPEGMVLDPFCGTGTTALVCAQAGLASTTVDINPFLVWLTRAKCAAYSAEMIAAAQNAIHSGLRAAAAPMQPGWKPPIKDIHKWWDADTLEYLARFYDAIRLLPLSPEAADLVNVVFCRAIIDVAAVSFGHQSMSFKPAQTPVSPVWDRLRLSLLDAARDVLSSAAEQPQSQRVTAIHGDARHIAALIPAASVATVVTSPPYPNRMSYIRELRPYMYWLGYLTSGSEAGDLDWQAIGGTWGKATSKLATWQPPTTRTIPFAPFNPLIAAINAHSSVLATYVKKYFFDIQEHLISLTFVLSHGAQVHYIVGNSRFYDVLLPTETIYAALFSSLGFTDVTITPLRKRTSKRELFEYRVSACWPGWPPSGMI